jgi:hypothetical protein
MTDFSPRQSRGFLLLETALSGPKKPQCDSDNREYGCWGRWVPVAHVVGTTRYGMGAAIGTRLSFRRCPYSKPTFDRRLRLFCALPHNLVARVAYLSRAFLSTPESGVAGRTPV